MKTLVTLFFSLILLQSISAQNIVYTFDYQIDMEEAVKYTDTTQNYKRVVGTLLNSKDRNYTGLLLYGKDSTDNELTIIDFKRNKNYIIYPHDKKREIMVANHQENGQVNITQLKADTNDLKRTHLIKKIGDYTSEQIFYANADYTYEVWFTKDVTNAPDNTFYAIDYYQIIPPSYYGIPVWFQYKSKNVEIRKDLISAKKISNKIVLKADKLLQFDDLLKDMTTPKQNE